MTDLPSTAAWSAAQSTVWTLAQQPASPAPAPASAAPRTVEIPGLPAQAAPAQATTGQPGATPVSATPAARPAGAPDMSFLFIITGFLVLLIVTSLFSGRKEKKRREQMLADLANGDRVQTIGGILGTIVDMSEQEATLRVDESSNIRIRFAKSAIQQVLRKANAKPEPAKA